MKGTFSFLYIFFFQCTRIFSFQYAKQKITLTYTAIYMRYLPAVINSKSFFTQGRLARQLKTFITLAENPPKQKDEGCIIAWR